MPTTIRTSGGDRSNRRQTAVVASTAATRATRVTTRCTGRGYRAPELARGRVAENPSTSAPRSTGRGYRAPELAPGRVAENRRSASQRAELGVERPAVVT